MFNCVILKRNGKPFAIVKTIEEAEFIRDLMVHHTALQHWCQWNCDWAYLDNLPF